MNKPANKLIILGNYLDQNGFKEEADVLDYIIKKTSAAKYPQKFRVWLKNKYVKAPPRSWSQDKVSWFKKSDQAMKMRITNSHIRTIGELGLEHLLSEWRRSPAPQHTRNVPGRYTPRAGDGIVDMEVLEGELSDLAEATESEQMSLFGKRKSDINKLGQEGADIDVDKDTDTDDETKEDAVLEMCEVKNTYDELTERQKELYLDQDGASSSELKEIIEEIRANKVALVALDEYLWSIAEEWNTSKPNDKITPSEYHEACDIKIDFNR